MTIVSVMKFNEQDGAIISDEEISGSATKSHLAEKLYLLNSQDTKVLLGASGSHRAIYMMVMDAWKKATGMSLDKEQAMALIGESIINIKGKIRDDYIRANLGMNYAELQKQLLFSAEKIDTTNIEKVLKSVNDDLYDFEKNFYVCLAKDKTGLEIFTFDNKLVTPIPRPLPYHSIGSGDAVANQIFASYFEEMKRGERKDIPPVQGLAILLYAVDESARKSKGVGGTPAMSILLGDKIYSPNEDRSRLATEIVRATNKGLLPKGFQTEALDALLIKETDFSEIDTEMKNNATDKQKLDLMLRGYKI